MFQPPIGRFLHYCTLDLGVPAHAQVVVAAPHRDLLGVLGKLLSVRESLGLPVHLLEHTVRVVHLLLLNLPMEETLVVEDWVGLHLCDNQNIVP